MKTIFVICMILWLPIKSMAETCRVLNKTQNTFWLKVYADGNCVFDGDFIPGQKFTFAVQNNIVFHQKRLTNICDTVTAKQLVPNGKNFGIKTSCNDWEILTVQVSEFASWFYHRTLSLYIKPYNCQA